MLPNTPPQSGLSHAEAQRRYTQQHRWSWYLRQGWVYVVAIATIVFTPLNTIILGLASLLWWFGAWRDAVLTAGVVCVNACVSIYQVIRAMYTLHAISLAQAPIAMVWRDDELHECHPTQVVGDDVVLLRPGDHVVADGIVMVAANLELDESMYTGESDARSVHNGELIRAGCTCVSGAAWYKVTSTAHMLAKLTTTARRFRAINTPLSRTIQRTVQGIVIVALGLIVVVSIRDTLLATPVLLRIQHATVMAGLIPNALVLALTLSYALAAIAMARAGMIVQQLPAVEALASIDTLCIDKTGTLTTNSLTLQQIHAIATSPTECRQSLARYVRADIVRNRTSDAINAALSDIDVVAEPVSVHIPFDSARKWSMQVGVTTTWVLGAPDVIAAALPTPVHMPDAVSNAIAHGARVLLFASTTAAVNVDEHDPQLPLSLRVDAFLVLHEQIREHTADLLAVFQAAGVQTYIVSGDDPQAVAALAHRVGIDATHVVHGSTFVTAPHAQQQHMLAMARVFGRTTPTDKATIIELLQANGRRVVMVGDGFNDIPALKAADVAVVLQSARSAVRDSADIVLLADDLAGLLALRSHGQHINTRMRIVLQHFIMRVGVSAVSLSAGLWWGQVIWTPFDSAMLALWGVALPSVLLITLPHLPLAAWLSQPRPTWYTLGVAAGVCVVALALCTVYWPTAAAATLWWLCMLLLWGRLGYGVWQQYASHTH